DHRFLATFELIKARHQFSDASLAGLLRHGHPHLGKAINLIEEPLLHPVGIGPCDTRRYPPRRRTFPTTRMVGKVDLDPATGDPDQWRTFLRQLIDTLRNLALD